MVVGLKVDVEREVRSPGPGREKKLRALEAMASVGSKGFYSSGRCYEGQTEGQRAQRPTWPLDSSWGEARLPAAQGPAADTTNHFS